MKTLYDCQPHVTAISACVTFIQSRYVKVHALVVAAAAAAAVTLQ